MNNNIIHNNIIISIKIIIADETIVCVHNNYNINIQ